MASDTCEVPQAKDGSGTSGVPSLLNLLQRPRAISIVPPVRTPLSLQVAWSMERPWELTYDCPLLADGHEYIPSPP